MSWTDNYNMPHCFEITPTYIFCTINMVPFQIPCADWLYISRYSCDHDIHEFTCWVCLIWKHHQCIVKINMQKIDLHSFKTPSFFDDPSQSIANSPLTNDSETGSFQFFLSIFCLTFWVHIWNDWIFTFAGLLKEMPAKI